jgi:hypothetical protein
MHLSWKKSRADETCLNVLPHGEIVNMHITCFNIVCIYQNKDEQILGNEVGRKQSINTRR